MTDPNGSPLRRRRIRICYFTTWARTLEGARAYVGRAPVQRLDEFVANPADAALMQKARLDCDWYAENARCFAEMNAEGLEFLPAWVTGIPGILELARAADEPGEERWLILSGHQPQALGDKAGPVFSFLARAGVRILFYAFDEASRFMPCFADIAPHLDVLIHDEAPLDPKGAERLRPECRRLHRSWVANFVPFSVPFNEEPERKILFLGSQLGLTEHRRRQIEFLRQRFLDRFEPSHDHSVSMSARAQLNRYKVGLCPEGRKFTTPAMARTHTDRPFWSGCLGLVPVAEDSTSGGRLEGLAQSHLIVRYAHGDLTSLAAACEQALDTPSEHRRRIYEHFNRAETIGAVVSEAIAQAPKCGLRPK